MNSGRDHKKRNQGDVIDHKPIRDLGFELAVQCHAGCFLSRNVRSLSRPRAGGIFYGRPGNLKAGTKIDGSSSSTRHSKAMLRISDWPSNQRLGLPATAATSGGGRGNGASDSGDD
jgi:hypothetical protein